MTFWINGTDGPPPIVKTDILQAYVALPEGFDPENPEMVSVVKDQLLPGLLRAVSEESREFLSFSRPFYEFDVVDDEFFAGSVMKVTVTTRYRDE